MKKKAPRVLILYTGGTFGMSEAPSERGQLTLPHLSPAQLERKLRERVPELAVLADCEIRTLLNRDSAHVGPEEWIRFAGVIRSEWKHYDGFVILHGTDTLAYSASALSFLLRPCRKPVVLTGAQKPLSALRTDARRNLISAVEIAARGPRPIVNQVTVFFDDRLHQGNRSHKRSSTDFAAFESPKSKPLALVGTSIRFDGDYRRERPASQRMTAVFSSRTLLLQLTPGFPSRAVTEGLLDRVDGLVLIAFPSATGPTHDPDFRRMLREARQRSIPVVIATGDSGFSTQGMSTYSAGSVLLEEGCHWSGNMTVECAWVKTSWILGQTDGQKKFSAYWKNNYAGEQST